MSGTMQPRTPDEEARWREALVLLDELLALPEAQRPDALDAVADTATRSLLLRWLDSHARSEGLLDGDAGAYFGHERGLQGKRFGRWRLDQEIGRGGMAVVYRATSVEAPAGQQAAVKILSLGALARQGGASRFVHEEQLLSRMRHPGIATLFDAGTGEDGTPWFAMALVEGERIDHWCERKAQDTRERVELLLQVCDAVAYAHRNLVIHRDIKPSNVLVDETGSARLLDFGIARLSELDAAPAPERTATALRALTPEYAAPEQFEGEPPSTAMDVFGLGALLYRLLTGHPPRRADAGSADTGTLSPSRAVRGDGARDPAQRRQLAKRLRGDLDTITMKALAHSPEQRYASVDAFAEDLRRWRDTRPIRARAPSVRYRAGRFVARNRWGVAATAAVAVALLAGVGGIAWQGEKARRQAERAELTQAFLRDVFDQANPLQRGNRAMRIEDVLRQAAQQAPQRFASRPDLQADALRMVGELQALNGDNSGAVQSLQAAARLEPAPAAAAWDDARRRALQMQARALTGIGRTGEARSLLQGWLDADRPSGHLTPMHCQGQAQLAGLLADGDSRRAQLQAARQDCLRLPAGSSARLAFAGALANALRSAGDHAASLALADAELGSLEALPDAGRGHWYERLQLDAARVHALGFFRRHAEAEAHARRTVQAVEAHVGKDSPLLAGPLQVYGNALHRMGRPDQALAQMRRARALIESHGEIQDRKALALLLLDMGVVAHQQGANRDAERYWEDALQAYADAGLRQALDVGTVMSNLSYARMERGAYREAADIGLQAVDFFRRRTPGRLDMIAVAEFNVCIALAQLQDTAAIAHCEQGAALDKRYTPDDTVLIGEGQQYLADAHCMLGQWPPALAAAERAIALLEPLAATGNQDAGHPLVLARHHRAEALAGLGQRAEARRALAAIRPADYDWPSAERARDAILR